MAIDRLKVHNPRPERVTPLPEATQAFLTAAGQQISEFGDDIVAWFRKTFATVEHARTTEPHSGYGRMFVTCAGNGELRLTDAPRPAAFMAAHQLMTRVEEMLKMHMLRSTPIRIVSKREPLLTIRCNFDRERNVLAFAYEVEIHAIEEGIAR